MLLAEIDGLSIDAGVAAIGNNCLGIPGLAVLVVHLAGVPDHGGHGSIDDYVTGNVQIGYTLGGVHHDHGDTPANQGLLVEIDNQGRETGRVLFDSGEGYRDLVLSAVAVIGTGETVAGGTALQEGGGRLGFDALLVLQSGTSIDVDHYGLPGENRESVYRLEQGEHGEALFYIKALGDDYPELTRFILPAAVSR